MELPRVDKRVSLMSYGIWKTEITYHPDYVKFDPNSPDIPLKARYYDDELIEIAEQWRAKISTGVSSSAISDEVSGFEIRTNNQTDFDGNVILVELSTHDWRKELVNSGMHFALEERAYTIYPQGFGVFRDILHLCYVGGEDHFSLLKRRFITGGDLAALRIIGARFSDYQ